MTTITIDNVKAKCTANEYMEELFTIGEIYNVKFKLENGQYGIINDNGDITCLPGDNFEFFY